MAVAGTFAFVFAPEDVAFVEAKDKAMLQKMATPLSFLGDASGHQLVNGKRRWSCTCCFQGAPAVKARAWLEEGPCPKGPTPSINYIPAELQEPYVILGHLALHQSHKLCVLI